MARQPLSKYFYINVIDALLLTKIQDHVTAAHPVMVAVTVKQRTHCCLCVNFVKPRSATPEKQHPFLRD